MRFDSGLLAHCGDVSLYPHVREWEEQAQLMEAAGYTAVYMAEHHFFWDGWATPVPANSALMSCHLAAKTSTLRLAQCGVSLTDQHPIRIAEDVAMIDHMSNGRVDFGMIRGINNRVAANFNRDADRRDVRRSQALFWEAYEIIRKAWTGEPFTHHGEFFDLPVPGWFDTSVDDPAQLDQRYYRDNGELYALSVLPIPYQRPGPPTYLMADSVSSYVEAARAQVGAISYGKSFEATREIYQTYRKAADLAADADVPLGIMRPVYVADSMAEADAVMRPAINTLMDVLAGIKGRASARKRYLATDEELTDQDRSDDWYDFLTRHGWTFCGTPDYVIERIKYYQATLGVNHLIQYWALPGFTHEQVTTSLRRFADEVMPAF